MLQTRAPPPAALDGSCTLVRASRSTAAGGGDHGDALEGCEMRPLAAHCHVALGLVYARGGDEAAARASVAAGLALLRDLGLSRPGPLEAELTTCSYDLRETQRTRTMRCIAPEERIRFDIPSGG